MEILEQSTGCTGRNLFYEQPAMSQRFLVKSTVLGGVFFGPLVTVPFVLVANGGS